MKTKKLTELALLTVVALIIFVVELQIPNPIPIPGAKLGLANIITVYAVYHYGAREVFLIIIVRVLLGSFFSGNMMALLFSLAGGLLCLVGMLVMKKAISKKYIWLCSLFGAVFHNIGQIVIACLIAGWGMLFYLPFLLVTGCLAGAFTGGCAQLVIHKKELQNILHYQFSDTLEFEVPHNILDDRKRDEKNK